MHGKAGHTYFCAHNNYSQSFTTLVQSGDAAMLQENTGGFNNNCLQVLVQCFVLFDRWDLHAKNYGT